MTDQCGKYLGDNDGTCPQLTCIRERGHAGLCDNVNSCSDEELENLLKRPDRPIPFGPSVEFEFDAPDIEVEVTHIPPSGKTLKIEPPVSFGHVEPGPKTCAVCNEPMTVEHTIARGQGGKRWVSWPPVIDTKGRTGHVECFIREGTVSLGGRTGPEFMDELDAGYQPTLAERILKPPQKNAYFVDVMKVSSCTCDGPGDGPCPRHGEEMAAQDARIAEENRRKLRASVSKESFLAAGPPLVHEGFKEVIDGIADEKRAQVEALLKNQREVVEHLDRRPLGGHSDLFPDLDRDDPRTPHRLMLNAVARQLKGEVTGENEITVTIPPGARADITIVHQPDGSVKADMQLDEGGLFEAHKGPVTLFGSRCTCGEDNGSTPDNALPHKTWCPKAEEEFAPAKGTISRGAVFEADTTKDPIVIRPLTQAAADIIDQARRDEETIAPLPTGPDYGKLIDSDAFDRAFETIVRSIGLPTEYLAAPGQEVFFVEYKVPALTGELVHAQGPYLTKRIAQKHYQDIFGFEGIEQAEIVGRPNVHAIHKPHPGQEMLDDAARGKVEHALRAIQKVAARLEEKSRESGGKAYILPENIPAYRKLCQALGIPLDEPETP